MRFCFNSLLPAFCYTFQHYTEKIMENYIFRRAIKENDISQIKEFFNEIYTPEKVGDLAEHFSHSLPGMKPESWFVAEEINSGKIVSACALIPWKINFSNTELNAAEMGIVATDVQHRNQGLMKRLGEEFDKEMKNNNYDISIIQGIPGFYSKMGYYYSVEFENHINLPLHSIGTLNYGRFSIRLGNINDLEFFMTEEIKQQIRFNISAKRSREEWTYLLGISGNYELEYAGEFYIIENESDKFYFKINFHGFGSGLIISEASENISFNAACELLNFCGELCRKRNKPYIRINLHRNAALVKTAFNFEAKFCSGYAWQIKIPDAENFLKKISPVLEDRISNSDMIYFSGIFRVNLYSRTIDINFKDGKITEICLIKSTAGNKEIQNLETAKTNETYILNTTEDMIPVIFFGHKNLNEINSLRPDTYTESSKAALLTEILFPKKDSWIYCRY